MFRNIDNESVTVEVGEDVYALFNTFELEDLALMNEFDRHAEHSELGEQELARRAEIVHGLTYEEIARIEKCKYQAIQYSIRSAIKKLKNYLAKKI